MGVKRLAIAVGLVALMSCGAPTAPQGQSPPPTSAAAPTESAEAGYEQYWATVERVDRRTCPSARCGVVGQLMFRESAHAYEIRDGWARITQAYDASCVGGRSEYVDRGEAACTEANGIVSGRFAEWVNLAEIGVERPADPAATATAEESLVAQSDDFQRYRRAFATAAAQLIADRRCTRGDFIDQGGWMKSVNAYRDQPVYFTYCGGMTNANRIYLDAETGRIFR